MLQLKVKSKYSESATKFGKIAHLGLMFKKSFFSNFVSLSENLDKQDNFEKKLEKSMLEIWIQ